MSLPLKINYLAIVSSLYLLVFVKGRERTSPKMGYKGRDVKQSIKRGMSKGGCTKGEMGIAILPKILPKVWVQKREKKGRMAI